MYGFCKPISLGDLQTHMLEKNLDISIATQELGKSRNAESEARALLYPTVDLVGSYAYFSERNRMIQMESAIKYLPTLDTFILMPTGKTKTVKLGDNDRADVGIDVAYPLTQAIVNKFNLQYRALGSSLKETQITQLENVLSFKLGMLYLQWEIARLQAKTQKRFIQQHERVYQNLQNQKESGIASRSRLLEASAKVAQSNYELVSFVNSADSIQQEIMQIAGIKDSTCEPIASSFDSSWGDPLNVAVDTLKPDLYALSIAASQFGALEKVQSGQHYPNLILTGGFRIANPGLALNDTVFMAYGMLGAQLRFTIFDGFKVKSQREQTRQNEDIVKTTRMNMYQTAQKNLVQLKSQFKKGEKQRVAAQTVYDAYAAVAADAKNSFDAGLITETDLQAALINVLKSSASLDVLLLAQKMVVLQIYFTAGRRLEF